MCSDFEIFWKSCSLSAFVNFDDMDLKIPPIERKWRVTSYREVKFLKFLFSEILHREDYRETIGNFFHLPRTSKIFKIWTSHFSRVFLSPLRSQRARFEEVRAKNDDFLSKRNFQKSWKFWNFRKKTLKRWGHLSVFEIWTWEYHQSKGNDEATSCIRSELSDSHFCKFLRSKNSKNRTISAKKIGLMRNRSVLSAISFIFS